MRDYTEQISEFWPTIMRAWGAHADKCPMIECDLANKKVRAYASGEYIDSLSERTSETTHREFVLPEWQTCAEVFSFCGAQLPVRENSYHCRYGFLNVWPNV